MKPDYLGGAFECSATMSNPAVTFASTPSSVHLLAHGGSLDTVLDRSDAALLVGPPAALPPCTTSLVKYSGSYWRYDARLATVQNNVSSPAAGSSATLTYKNGCPNVPKTFLNRGGCVVRDTCAPALYSSARVQLNASVLREFYVRSTKYVYVIDGLRLEDEEAISPCDGASRWRYSAGNCTSDTPLDVSTRATLADALAASADTNPHVRDIEVTTGVCSTNVDGVSAIGAKLSGGGACWEHVHSDTYSVYDFSYWELNHVGNEVALANGRRNPIAAFAENGGTSLWFPAHHMMDQWADSKKYMGLLGRLDDTIDFAALPTVTQTEEMAELLGALGASGAGGVEACGSPGEVSNEPSAGHHRMWACT